VLNCPLVKVSWRNGKVLGQEKDGEKGKNLSGVFTAVGQNLVINIEKALFSSLSFRIYIKFTPYSYQYTYSCQF